MLTQDLLKKLEEQTKKTVEKYRAELMAVRTGRANVSLVENIEVDAYGGKMKLNQVANFNILEGKTIEIRPWDGSVLPGIEKAIASSNLGLTPMNDGKCVKLSVPPLTDERRQELSRQVNKSTEQYRVAVRNERRGAVDAIRGLEKDKKITEDEKRKSEEQSQKLADVYIKKIDEILAAKVKEIQES